MCVPIRSDRKSTRLNSSHSQISYAVFCLKKKRRAIPLTLRLLINQVNPSTNLATHFLNFAISKTLTHRVSLSKHLAYHLGRLMLLGKIGVFNNRRNASSRLLLLLSKHLILWIYLVFRILA